MLHYKTTKVSFQGLFFRLCKFHNLLRIERMYGKLKQYIMKINEKVAV